MHNIHISDNLKLKLDGISEEYTYTTHEDQLLSLQRTTYNGQYNTKKELILFTACHKFSVSQK